MNIPGLLQARFEVSALGCWIWTGTISDKGYGLISKRMVERERNAPSGTAFLLAQLQEAEA